MTDNDSYRESINVTLPPNVKTTVHQQDGVEFKQVFKKSEEQDSSSKTTVIFDPEEFELVELEDSKNFHVRTINLDKYLPEIVKVKIPATIHEQEIIPIVINEVITEIEDPNNVVYQDEVLIVPYLEYNCLEDPRFIHESSKLVNCERLPYDEKNEDIEQFIPFMNINHAKKEISLRSVLPSITFETK